jgi:hypothetical protein
MNTNHQEEKYLRAKAKLDNIKGFHSHLLTYLIVNLFLLLFFYKLSGGITAASLSTMFFWGIGLVFHAGSVYSTHLFFGKRWEDRKIKQLIEEDRKKK